jgi:DNA polymerase I-like protein with 3'-5' exonuclease and polymerase domains
MALYGGVEIPGHPCLENVRKLDLLPIPLIRRAHRVGIAIDPPYFKDLSLRFGAEILDLERDISSYIPVDRLREFSGVGAKEEDDDEDRGSALDSTTDSRSIPSPHYSSSSSFNANSPDQMAKLLYDMLGIGAGKKLKTTNTGRTSTGKKQLELIKLEHPVVPLVLRHRELSKLKLNYADKLPRLAVFHPHGSDCPVCGLRHPAPTWRVHCEMGTTRADTGRINHKNPNEGNVPSRTDDGQAIQAGHIPTPGHKLVIADLSQIELRGLAHLSNCASMIAVYDSGGDLHNDTCWRTGLIPHGDKPDVATRVAAKGCIAKGQRVLTNRGLVAIEAVTCYDLVWDGIEFVSHDGIVHNGICEVITYDGLTATPDHEVYGPTGAKAPLRTMQREGVRVAIGGAQETPVRYAYGYEQEDTSERDRVLSDLRVLLPLPKYAGDIGQQRGARGRSRLPMLQRPQVWGRSKSQNIGRSLYGNQAALRQSEQRELSQLRRTRDSESLYGLNRICRVCAEAFASCELQGIGYWKKGQRWTLRAGKLGVANTSAKYPESQKHEVCKVQRCKTRRRCIVQEVESGLPGFPTEQETHFDVGCDGSLLARDLEEKATQTSEVYDILNAGPRHRFVVEDKVVSNCNFAVVNGTTEKGLYLQLVVAFGARKMSVPEWLTEDWCKRFIVDWLESRPEVREYFELQWYRARRYGLVWTSFGRIKLIPEVQSCHSWIRESGLRQAQNLPITGLAADQLKLIMGKLDAILQKMWDQGVWVWPLLTVHDSVMIESEDKYAEEVLELTRDVMDQVMDDEGTGDRMFRVPIESDGLISERWTK